MQLDLTSSKVTILHAANKNLKDPKFYIQGQSNLICMNSTSAYPFGSIHEFNLSALTSTILRHVKATFTYTSAW